MKHLLPAALLLLAVATDAAAQSPITLTNSGYPTTGSDSIASVSNLSSFTMLSAPATNATWDLSAARLGTTISYALRSPAPAGNPYPAANYYNDATYNFGGGLHYNVALYVQNDASGIIRLGETKPIRQARGLGPFTGTLTDSIIFPVQTMAYSLPYFLIKFPATMSSSWNTTNSKWATQFTVTVASAGLSSAPGERRSSRTIRDTVVGWGRMRIPQAGGGISGYMPVLQVRETKTVTDSFYLNGSPASAAMLSGFGLAQGQETSYYSTLFYRAGEVTPLAELDHPDSTFSGTPNTIYLHEGRLAPNAVTTIAGVGEVKIYPNPARDVLHISAPRSKADGWRYALISMTGQQVASGSLSLSASQHSAKVALPEGLSSGIYLLQLRCGNAAATLPVTVK